MSESNVTIVFAGEDVSADDFILVSLDSEANGGKTTFEKGDTVFLKVFYTEEYEYTSSGGVLKLTKTKVPQEVNDSFVIFAGVSEGYLSYPPEGSVVYSWVGNDGGSPTFDGRHISVPESVVAVLRCNYTTLSDQFSLKFEETGAVVVLVISAGGSKSSRTVYFNTDEIEPVPYNIKISDYCSGDTLSGATVGITTGGSPIEGEVLVGGVTDDSGEVYLGMLIPGRRYELSMTCSGYLDSSVDKINNDYFVVPS